MKWKKPVIAVAFTGLVLFTAAGCAGVSLGSNKFTAGPSSQATTPRVQRNKQNLTGDNTFSENGTRPFRPSDNRTMPLPPSTTGATAVPPGCQPGGALVMPVIDWAAAAQSFGVTEDALKAAVGDLSAGMPHFAAIARDLGITEQSLMEALGFKSGDAPPRGTSPQREK
jgi:hypothetical protein